MSQPAYDISYSLDRMQDAIEFAYMEGDLTHIGKCLSDLKDSIRELKTELEILHNQIIKEKTHVPS